MYIIIINIMVVIIMKKNKMSFAELSFSIDRQLHVSDSHKSVSQQALSMSDVGHEYIPVLTVICNYFLGFVSEVIIF